MIAYFMKLSVWLEYSQKQTMTGVIINYMQSLNEDKVWGSYDYIYINEELLPISIENDDTKIWNMYMNCQSKKTYFIIESVSNSKDPEVILQKDVHIAEIRVLTWNESKSE